MCELSSFFAENVGKIQGKMYPSTRKCAHTHKNSSHFSLTLVVHSSFCCFCSQFAYEMDPVKKFDERKRGRETTRFTLRQSSSSLSKQKQETDPEREREREREPSVGYTKGYTKSNLPLPALFSLCHLCKKIYAGTLLMA